MADDPKKLVLEAAKRRFLQQGLDKVSLEDVAEEAGVTISKIKAIFPTPTDILRGLLTMGIDETTASISNILARRGKPDLKINHLVRELLKRYDQHYPLDKLVSISFETLGEESLVLRGVLSAEQVERYHQNTAIIARLIAKGQSENLFISNVDPLEAAYVLRGMINFVIKFRDATNNKVPLINYARNIIRIFLKGLYR